MKMEEVQSKLKEIVMDRLNAEEDQIKHRQRPGRLLKTSAPTRSISSSSSWESKKNLTSRSPMRTLIS